MPTNDEIIRKNWKGTENNIGFNRDVKPTITNALNEARADERAKCKKEEEADRWYNKEDAPKIFLQTVDKNKVAKWIAKTQFEGASKAESFDKGYNLGNKQGKVEGAKDERAKLKKLIDKSRDAFVTDKNTACTDMEVELIDAYIGLLYNWINFKSKLNQAD